MGCLLKSVNTFVMHYDIRTVAYTIALQRVNSNTVSMSTVLGSASE